MSRTPSQAGPGGAGGAPPQRPAAHPAPKVPPKSPPQSLVSSAPISQAAAQAKYAAVAPKVAPAPAAAAPPPKTAVAPSAPAGKSVSGPAAKPPKPDYFSRPNLIKGGSVAAGLALIIALFVWRPWSPRPPRLNEQPYKIAQFTASAAMDRLPWSQQREYMDILAGKDEALLAAYKEGKLDDQQYRRALQLGWYDKHLDRMEKFFSRPAGVARLMYVDEKVLGKKLKKTTKDHPAAVAAPGKKDPKPKKEKSDESSPLSPEEIDRDNSTEEQDIKKWPADVRQKWTEYRAAVSTRKEFFKEQERLAKEKKKAATTAPAGAPPKSAGPAAGTTGQPAGAADGDVAEQ